MKKRTSGLAAIAGVCLGFSQANAASVLDANYTAASISTSIIVGARLSLAQTFTVQSTGLMTNVMVNVSAPGANNPANAPLQLQIRTLSGGLPSEASSGSTVLASTTLSPIPDVSWVNADFADFSVTAGQQLALVLMSNTTASEYAWYGDLAWTNYAPGYANGTYSGGRAYSEGYNTPNGLTWHDIDLCNNGCNIPANVDMSFRTYVDTSAQAAVPEPAGWAMMIGGFGMVGASLRRTHRWAAKVA